MFAIKLQIIKSYVWPDQDLNTQLTVFELDTLNTLLPEWYLSYIITYTFKKNYLISSLIFNFLQLGYNDKS